MGLYHIQLKHGAAEHISATMTAIGLPVTRIEQRDNRTHYFYEDSGCKRERSFWTHAQSGELFWCCGVGSTAKQIAEGFSAAGLFANHERAA